MKQNARKTHNNSVQQMTDAELRRALDYQVGDVVLLHDYDGRPQGVIDGAKLTRNNKNFMYVVQITSEKGIKFVLACADDMDFIRHSDGEI